MSAPRESAVLQLVRANDAKHEQGHLRLRKDWREHEERLTELEHAQRQTESKLSALIATPPDLGKATLSTGTVIALVLGGAGIVAGQVALTRGLSSDIRDINTQLSLRAKADESLQKLQDERAKAQQTATEAIGKKQELLQIKFDELRDQVIGQQRKLR